MRTGDDDTALLVTREANDWLDATRWLGQWPILDWCVAGPTGPRAGPMQADLVERLHARVLPAGPPSPVTEQRKCCIAVTANRPNAHQLIALWH
ncbi:MAG: hypothetical protein CL927_15275 [Deltaproteobacteria bacterium]|nr:hypothetical protein [Deltaproteobacteria bacterium]HCH64515.1 hypothetical protein [Deltaproteobacteria bacterium]